MGASQLARRDQRPSTADHPFAGENHRTNTSVRARPLDLVRAVDPFLESSLKSSKQFISRLVCSMTLVVSSTAALAAGYEIHTLPSYSAFGGVQVFGINNSGQIVGNGFTDAGGKAFVYQAGVYTVFDGPAGATSSSAMGITTSGAIIGTYADGDAGDPNNYLRQKGFLKTGTAYEALDYPGVAYSNPRGISSDGRYVAGFSGNVSDGRVGYVLDRSTGEYISTRNELGGFPQGVNNAGIAVGDVATSGTGYDRKWLGFTFDASTGLRTEYSFAGYDNTRFRGINNVGQIVGWLQGYDPAANEFLEVGFVGTPSSFEILAVPGASRTTAQSINDAGWVVGNYVLNGEYFGFVATPIPEPETYALMLAGLTALVVMQRRRTKAA
jgi:PEP-CTERM motif